MLFPLYIKIPNFCCLNQGILIVANWKALIREKFEKGPFIEVIFFISPYLTPVAALGFQKTNLVLCLALVLIC